jgi:hypothetical protein
VDLANCPLLDNNNDEIAIYDHAGKRINRRKPIPDPNEPPCGVLVNLTNIEALFHAGPDMSDDEELMDGSPPPPSFTAPHIDVYPLGFLRTAGNIKATGIPRCFLPVLRRINEKIREENDREQEEDEENFNDGHLSELLPDPVVFPVSCQLYNLITHRTASRSGSHESQQGSVTSALAGAYARTVPDKRAAEKKRRHCDAEMPSDRFHRSISLEDCPKSCRAELVYAIDLRRISFPSGG